MTFAGGIVDTQLKLCQEGFWKVVDKSFWKPFCYHEVFAHLWCLNPGRTIIFCPPRATGCHPWRSCSADCNPLGWEVLTWFLCLQSQNHESAFCSSVSKKLFKVCLKTYLVLASFVSHFVFPLLVTLSSLLFRVWFFSFYPFDGLSGWLAMGSLFFPLPPCRKKRSIFHFYFLPKTCSFLFPNLWPLTTPTYSFLGKGTIPQFHNYCHQTDTFYIFKGLAAHQLMEIFFFHC